MLTQNPKLISPWMVEPHVFGIASVPLDIMRWGGGVVSEERFAPGTIATVLSRVLCGVVVFVGWSETHLLLCVKCLSVIPESL